MKKTLILSVLIFSPPVFAHDLDNHKIHGFISTNLAAKTVSEGTRWRVCIYHNAPSETACPVISSKHKPWAQSWISSIGSGLGLPRLYSTGFRLPVFVSTSTKSNTPLMPSFSADTCTVRSKRTPLRVSGSPESTRS